MKHNKKVIPSSSEPESQPWTFLDYCSQDGKSSIQEWIEGEGEDAQFMLDALIKELSKVNNHLEWSAFRCFIRGEAYKKERIWELGFKANGKQYRILGKFDGPKQVKLLCGCYHKQNVYTPANALEIALTRAQEDTKGKAKFHVRKIKADL